MRHGLELTADELARVEQIRSLARGIEEIRSDHAAIARIDDAWFGQIPALDERGKQRAQEPGVAQIAEHAIECAVCREIADIALAHELAYRCGDFGIETPRRLSADDLAQRVDFGHVAVHSDASRPQSVEN